MTTDYTDSSIYNTCGKQECYIKLSSTCQQTDWILEGTESSAICELEYLSLAGWRRWQNIYFSLKSKHEHKWLSQTSIRKVVQW